LKIFDPVEDVHSTFWLRKFREFLIIKDGIKFLLRIPKLISLNFEIRLALFYLREKKPSTLTEEREILYTTLHRKGYKNFIQLSSIFSVLFSKIMEGGLLKRYVKDKKKECSAEKNLIGEGRWRNRCTYAGRGSALPYRR
jgi:hypothetical protein